MVADLKGMQLSYADKLQKKIDGLYTVNKRQ